MIDLLFQIALNNVFISLVLAIAAAIVGITLKRPAITYLMWLLVFVKLLTPPVVTVPAISIPWMSEATPTVKLNFNEEQDFRPIKVSGSAGNAYLSTETRSGVLIQGKHGLFLAWVLGSTIVFSGLCFVYTASIAYWERNLKWGLMKYSRSLRRLHPPWG